MFGKKILSIVGLLFLGSQVSGTDLFSCPTPENPCGGDVTGLTNNGKYCIDSESKIYQFETGTTPGAVQRRAEGPCLKKGEQISTEGIHVFEDDGNGGTYLGTLGSGSTYSVSNENNLKIYNCNTGGNTCTQKYGYSSIGETYYNIPKTSITLCSTVSDYTTPCSSGTASGSYKYCLDNDGTVFKYESGTSCVYKEQVEAGVYVFEDGGSNGGATLINLGAATSQINNKDNLMLYHCSKGSTNVLKCSRTYGYINDKYDSTRDDYYAISADGTVTKYASGSGLEASCSSGSNTGKLSTNKKLCLFGEAASPIESNVITTPGTYIMNNVEGNVFTNGLGATDGSSGKSIVIKSNGTIMYLVSDDYDYCFDEHDVATPTFEEFCNNQAESCSNKAECSSTLCKRTQDAAVAASCSITIGAGGVGTGVGCTLNAYYLVDNASQGAVGDYLYQCNVNDGKTCNKISKIGYFKDGADNNKYIKCETADSCVNINVVTDKTDCNNSVNVGDIIKISGGEGGESEVLCLDTSKANGITLGGQANYFVGNNNIFNNEETGKKFVKVDVDTDSVVLSAKLASDTGNKYEYTDTDFKVYARAIGNTEPNAICSASKTIVEFKHTQGDCPSDCETDTPYYEIHVVYQWPADSA